MNFADRYKPAKQFEHQVESYLARSGFAVVKNGSEHTCPDFAEKIRNDHSTAAKLIRYAPDGLALIDGRVTHWEAKASDSIEKDAYLHYKTLALIGANMLLFFKSEAGVYCQWIELIRFLDSTEIVNKYPKKSRYPVDPDGWICPPNRNSGSGTPYKKIDFDSLNLIADFEAE